MDFRKFRHLFSYLFCYNYNYAKDKGGNILDSSKSSNKKCGTVTVSVYRDNYNRPFFKIQSDTDDVLPVSYVIEDALYLY